MRTSRTSEINEALKKRIFEHYGEKCNCCGETIKKFLTIDHKNNDGYKDKDNKGNRKSGYRLYKKIIDENYPDTYQILCWNCNCGKSHNGGICPHEYFKIINNHNNK